MITELTKEQKELLTVYRDKWMAIGLSTEPANRKEAERGVDEMYRIAGLKPPKKVWCLSPLSSGLTSYCVMNIKEVNVGENRKASVRASVRDSVWASVRASVWASVRASVWASVMASVYGQHDAYWLGFYDYFKNVLKLEKQTEKLNGLWILSKNAGWIIPHENICWISERHNVCKLKNGVIHCDGGPAIQYPDGFSIWGLNGVRVPQYLAETPEGKLDIDFFHKEKNADVRTEFVRKYGIERMAKLGKVVETSEKYSNDLYRQSEYELIDMGNILDKNYRPYLKMRNLTTNIYHIEGVSPECRTIEQALQFRTKNRLTNLKGVK